MQRALTRILPVLLLAMAASGCAVVGGIFKAGVAVGVVIVVVIVILLFVLFGRR